MHSLFWPFFNVAVLIGLFVHYLRDPVRSFVGTRHTTLRDELQRVGTQLRQARARYDEFSGKLKALDSEIAALRAQAKQDAQAMKLRVLADAKRIGELTVSDARTSSQALYDELKTQLRTELSTRLIERAEQLLRERLTSDDRVRIRREFSSQVGRMQ